MCYLHSNKPRIILTIKGILPGNSKSLWQAVKIAKNVGETTIPDNMSLNSEPVSSHELSEHFARFFERKVADILSSTNVNQSIHNGSRKIYATDSMFMTWTRIKECINELKLKNTEGYDQIPQRILIDGCNSLIDPLFKLFELIYRDGKVPEQWLISKIIVQSLIIDYGRLWL